VTGYGKFLGALISISSQDISRWHPRVAASFPEEKKKHICIYTSENIIHIHSQREASTWYRLSMRRDASNKTPQEMTIKVREGLAQPSVSAHSIQ